MLDTLPFAVQEDTLFIAFVPPDVRDLELLQEEFGELASKGGETDEEGEPVASVVLFSSKNKKKVTWDDLYDELRRA